MSMNIGYKLLQNDDKKKVVLNNFCFDENTGQNNSYQILIQSQKFIDGNFEDIEFLTEEIPKSSDDFLDYLFSRFDFIKKLIDVDFSNIQEVELKLSLQMIYAITSLQIFRSNYTELNSVYNFSISTVKNLIHNYKSDVTSINIQLSLDCIGNLINENNFRCLDQSFFEDIRSIFFLNDEISISCSKIVEKMSFFVQPNHTFQYYFNFLKNICININPTIAYYLYSTLLNIIKILPDIVRIPSNEQMLSNKPHSFWVYEMITNSYRYKYDVQSIAFDICSYLKGDAICILEDSNIKNNILCSLTQSDDERTISAIHALKNFLLIDSKRYAKYFTEDNITNMAPYLINHVLNSSYKVKEQASYLFCFAMQCSPKFFAKGFIEPYSNFKSIKDALEFEEEAIISIFSYDDTDLLIQLLKGLLAISNECLEWGVKNELYMKFSQQIIPIYDEIKSNDEEQVANLMSNLIELLTPTNDKENI